MPATGIDRAGTVEAVDARSAAIEQPMEWPDYVSAVVHMQNACFKTYQ